MKAEPIKLLEDDRGVNLHDLAFGNRFLRYQNNKNKRKNRQIGLYQIKYFCASVDTIKKVKDNLQMGGNICKSLIQ